VAVLLTGLISIGSLLVREAARPVRPPVSAFAAVTLTCDGHPAVAPREVRGMWLTTVENIDWPSRPGLDEQTVKAEFLGWLDVAVKAHHNVIYVDIRPSGDSFWPSAYAPWSQWLTGKLDGSSPGWDPLAWMIEQTHARNLQFHAWFNPYRGDQPAPQGPGAALVKLPPNHPLLAHPGWAVTYPVGTPDSRLYFDPGIPAARHYIEDSMLDAVARYDIDGVDFDDFFYPYPEDGQDFNDSVSFLAYGLSFRNTADWRRNNVNLLIREMSERIHALKPWVTFGISTFGIWRNRSTDPGGSATAGLQSYDEIYADSRTWVTQHWVDSITPQLYWSIGNKPADYAVLLRWWSNLVAGTGVQLYIALADYRAGEHGPFGNPSELDRQMALNRQFQVAGTVHYNATSVRDDAIGEVSRYEHKYYSAPALVPTMARLPSALPPPPILTAIRPGSGGIVTVTWHAGVGTRATSYAVYRLDPGVAEAQLVATVRAQADADQSVVDHPPGGSGSRYCVAGLDRSDNQGPLSSALG
jgi:uncharacterized lipoprotein YddW (UPF0748 family)